MLKAGPVLVLLLLAGAPDTGAATRPGTGVLGLQAGQPTCLYDSSDLPQFSPLAAEADASKKPHDPSLVERVMRYAQLALKHRVSGLASYYSSFFDGRKTANGEIFRNGKYSAAHLTLPLGTWIEVTSRATGRKLRMRVNDRGPYAKKFCLDLSQAAARYLGVDVARDRHVDVRIIALPGEEPLEDDGTQIAESQPADSSR